MTFHAHSFRLSAREQVGHGVSEAEVFATREQPMNPGRLKHDEYVARFRFLVAYMHDCTGGKCQVWTETFTNYDEAKAFLNARLDAAEPATLYSILPADMAQG